MGWIDPPEPENPDDFEYFCEFCGSPIDEDDADTVIDHEIGGVYFCCEDHNEQYRSM